MTRETQKNHCGRAFAKKKIPRNNLFSSFYSAWFSQRERLAQLRRKVVRGEIISDFSVLFKTATPGGHLWELQRESKNCRWCRLPRWGKKALCLASLLDACQKLPDTVHFREPLHLHFLHLSLQVSWKVLEMHGHTAIISTQQLYSDHLITYNVIRSTA